jgi:hypothetical protein
VQVPQAEWLHKEVNLLSSTWTPTMHFG